MDLGFAALLGLVQGLTEFLPISSTAHLRVIPALLGMPDPGAAFTAVIQIGTLAAVIVYYRERLRAMVRGLVVERGGDDARLALLVVAGTVPIGVAGILLEKHIEGPLRSLWVIASALMAVAVLMVLADRSTGARRSLDALRFSDALWIGVAQAAALVPGVSRSGATMTMALLIGLTRPAAAEFSFLLSIPALGAAGLFEMDDALAAFHGELPIPLIVATLVSAVSGYAAIAWLLRFLRSNGFLGFALYRVALGGVLAGLLAAGVLSGRG